MALEFICSNEIECSDKIKIPKNANYYRLKSGKIFFFKSYQTSDTENKIKLPHLCDRQLPCNCLLFSVSQTPNKSPASSGSNIQGDCDVKILDKPLLLSRGEIQGLFDNKIIKIIADAFSVSFPNYHEHRGFWINYGNPVFYDSKGFKVEIAFN